MSLDHDMEPGEDEALTDFGTFDADSSPTSRDSPGTEPQPTAGTMWLGVFSLLTAAALLLSSGRRTKPLHAARAGRDAATCFAPTILISIDGFHPGYLHRRYNQARDGNTSLIAPTLVRLAAEGAFSNDGMVPVMPSITFPNHWSMITGLFPESSGILANVMYDPARNATFLYDGANPEWWHGEPFWKTVQRTKRVPGGPPRASAAVFWPGSSVPTLRPNAYLNYSRALSYTARVDTLLRNLDGSAPQLRGRRADFATLYFEGVDSAGHVGGPHSPLVSAEIARVERALQYLFARLGPDWAQRYNVVVVSDHGMAEVRKELAIDLDRLVRQGSLRSVVTTPFGMYYNVGVSARKLVARARERLRRRHGPHAQMFTKDGLPEKWHLKRSRLMTPVAALAQPGFWFRLKSRPFRVRSPVWGAHGYDHTLPDMRAIFMAMGPSFKKRSRVPVMDIVDVYPMLCSIFGADPAPNNGSLSKTRALLNTC